MDALISSPLPLLAAKQTLQPSALNPTTSTLNPEKGYATAASFFSGARGALRAGKPTLNGNNFMTVP